jgi:hypothetical protein
VNDWISALEASNLARAAGRTEGDLIEWARLGMLQVRARSGTFSDDDPDVVREFPNEPPSDEIKRAVSGPWPNIPADFWEATPTKALWGPGTFASRLEYWNDHYQSDEYESITLLGVTFLKDELNALLSGRQPKAVMGQPPKERWQQQRVSEQQKVAFEFLEKCRKHPPKDWHLGPIAQHAKYVEWAERQKDEPLGRTAFGKWAKRYADGWRVAGSKWEHTG